MTRRTALAVGVGLAMLLPALAFATDLQDNWSGYAQHNGPAPGVYANNLPYQVHAILNSPLGQPNPWSPWYPWQAGYEYTVVIDAIIVTYNGLPYPWVPGVNGSETADFNVASVSIYEDNTTPADYANPGTFTDGTLVLSGVIQNMIGEHTVYWGVVVFTGGTGIGNLNSQCSGGLVGNDFINFFIGTPPAGYQESYDIQWICPEATDVQETTWGAVKGLYR